MPSKQLCAHGIATTFAFYALLYCGWICFAASQIPSSPETSDVPDSRQFTEEELQHQQGILDTLKQLRGVKVYENTQGVRVDVDARRSEDSIASITSGLAQLPYLHTVWFTNSTLSQEEFRAVSRLSQISYLGFLRGQVSEAGLLQLTRMRHLKSLGICVEEFSANAARWIPDFESLESLNLGWSCIDDQTLAHLSRCRTLKNLSLCECHCGGLGLKSIAQIQTLEAVSFTNMGFDYRAGSFFNAVRDEDLLLRPEWPNTANTKDDRFGYLREWLTSQRPGLKIWWSYMD